MDKNSPDPRGGELGRDAASGRLDGRSAAISQGYANDPDDHGLLLIDSQRELDRIIGRIHTMGYQACVHANGDIAINMVLDAIERAQRESPRRQARHRIEHCTRPSGCTPALPPMPAAKKTSRAC